MPVIGINTLQFAIEAVARELRELRQLIDDDDALPEDHVRFDDLGRMADELEAQYDEAARTVLNLAPYDELVGR